MKRSPYEILGISPSATARDIKDAYRTLAKRLHPDQYRDPEADGRFHELTEAYDTAMKSREITDKLLEAFKQFKQQDERVAPARITKPEAAFPVVQDFTTFSGIGLELAKRSRSLGAGLTIMVVAATLDHITATGRPR